MIIQSEKLQPGVLTDEEVRQVVLDAAKELFDVQPNFVAIFGSYAHVDREPTETSDIDVVYGFRKQVALKKKTTSAPKNLDVYVYFPLSGVASKLAVLNIATGRGIVVYDDGFWQEVLRIVDAIQPRVEAYKLLDGKSVPIFGSAEVQVVEIEETGTEFPPDPYADMPLPTEDAVFDDTTT